MRALGVRGGDGILNGSWEGCEGVILPFLDEDLFEDRGVGPGVYKVLERPCE